MPELPEVETMKRGIAAVVGCRIRGVVRPKCRLRPIQISPDFARLRPMAAALLAPYLAWTCYACYLNIGFWWLNRN